MDDTFLFLRVAAFAASVPLLGRLPIRRLQSLVEPRSVTRVPDPARVQQLIRYVDSYCRAARPLISRRCMTRGLTLYFFLRREGVDLSLTFGVGNDLENFTGHCWLVQNGKPYLESIDPRPFFTPIYSFDNSSADKVPSVQVEEARG